MAQSGGTPSHTASAALAALTRAAAVELERERITVNALALVTTSGDGAEDDPALESYRGALGAERLAPVALHFLSAAGASRTGQVLAAAGPRLAPLRLCEGRGLSLAGDEPWTADSVDRHWAAIVKP